MQIAYDIVAVLGKLSLMAIVLGLAVLVSQAFWAGFIVTGARMVRQRQVLSLRDVILAMREDGVWLAYLLKNPVACIAALFAGALVFRAGLHHPGWVGVAMIAAFFAFGPVLRRVRKTAAAFLMAGAVSLFRKAPTP